VTILESFFTTLIGGFQKSFWHVGNSEMELKKCLRNIKSSTLFTVSGH
jgi:hypothetical protein